MRKEYWHCLIGPATPNELAPGADGPMRLNIERVFRSETGHRAEVCSSGWGTTPSEVTIIQKVLFMTPPEQRKIRAAIREIEDGRGGVAPC